MSQIVEKMRQEIMERSARFEEQTKGTKDEYNIYREHIQYVYKYVVLLSKDKNVDKEVLELSALLHDISMTDITLDRSRHNEFGADIAEQLLRENDYPEDKVQLVKKCKQKNSSGFEWMRDALYSQLLQQLLKGDLSGEHKIITDEKEREYTLASINSLQNQTGIYSAVIPN